MRYRVYNYAAAFRGAGIAVTTIDFEEASFADVEDADVLVFCRVPESPVLCEIIARFRSTGRPVIYDIDDLVFDPDRIEYLRATKRGDPERTDLVRALLTGTLAMMRHFDLVTVSTFALKLEVERLGKAAHVIPNTLAPSEARPGDARMPAIPKRGRRLRTIYLSGTATHEDDFAVCQPALMRIMREYEDFELLVVGPLDAAKEFECFGERLIRHPFVPHETMFGLLQTADINLAPLEPGNPFTNCKSELKVFEPAFHGIPTIASPVSGYGSVIVHGVNGLLAVSSDDWYECLSMLRANPERRVAIGREAKRSIAPRFRVSETVEEALAVYSLARARQYRKPLTRKIVDDELPTITVVAPLYNKAAEVTFFLDALRRQSYRGRYEIVLVDDCTPDASVEIVGSFQRYQMTACDTNPNMRLRIISAVRNAGNCVSRNIGIREADGDIIVVVDADCMSSRDFLALHAQAYAYGDCDVAIGPINIETNGKPPLAVLNAYELDPNLGDTSSEPQDPTVRDSFVNCITRNFSIQRSFLATVPGAELFDEEFGYSSDPRSGFGWEDVEMGCRLYAARARIKYVAAAASIHVSHPSAADSRAKPLRSLRNFRRLHDRHPDLILAARPWSVQTYDAIVDWTRSVGASLETNDDYNALDPRFRRYARSPIVIDRSRPLRILTYRWHCAHQYELYRLGHDITLVHGGGTAICDSWGWDTRPLPANARFRAASDIDPRDFDVAM
jgi:glycosyltransferase involved in cell wall biosynthesis